MPTLTPLAPVGRLSEPVRTALAWSGAVLSTLLLNGWLFAGDLLYWPFGLRLVVPVLGLLLLGGLLRRYPFVALALLLVNVAALEPVVPAELSEPVLPWEAQPDGVDVVDELRTCYLVAVAAAVGRIAATHRRRVSVVTAILTFGVQLVVATVLLLDFDDRVTQNVLAILCAWVIGNSVRQRRMFAEEQRTEAARNAAQAERLRIARELHDLIAHSIGVIAMQAGMGRRVIDTQPDEARNALAVIEDTGRDTLAALRRTLATLRQADAPPGHASAAEGESARSALLNSTLPHSTPLGSAPLEPAPGLADLDRLAARSRAAGVHVEVRSRGERRPLPPDVELSAYRIIQEAITNVARHSGTHRCEVVVEHRPDRLSIDVTDDGRGGAVGVGFGISGMRERVSLLGGEFEAGPRPAGGFQVAASIPLPAATR